MDFNITLVIQLVNFIIVLLVLNPLIIAPIRKRIRERNEILAGFTSATEKFNATAADRLKNYEAALQEARAEAGRERETIKNEGVQQEQKLIASAQGKAQSMLEGVRQTIAGESAAARHDLAGQVERLAESACARILN